MENDRRLGDTHRQQNACFPFSAADGHGENEDNQYHAHSGNDNNEGGNQGASVGKGAGNILIHFVIGSNDKVIPVNRGYVLYLGYHVIQLCCILYEKVGLLEFTPIFIINSHFFHCIVAAKSIIGIIP